MAKTKRYPKVVNNVYSFHPYPRVFRVINSFFPALVEPVGDSQCQHNCGVIDPELHLSDQQLVLVPVGKTNEVEVWVQHGGGTSERLGILRVTLPGLHQRIEARPSEYREPDVRAEFAAEHPCPKRCVHCGAQDLYLADCDVNGRGLTDETLAWVCNGCGHAHLPRPAVTLRSQYVRNAGAKIWHMVGDPGGPRAICGALWGRATAEGAESLDADAKVCARCTRIEAGRLGVD
jgi:hypothetical protein